MISDSADDCDNICFEPATFRVLGGRDNHYTTETCMYALVIYGMSEMPRSKQTNGRIEECVVGTGSAVSFNLISDEVGLSG